MNFRTRLEVYLEQRNALGYLDYSNEYEYLTPAQRRRLRKKDGKEIKKRNTSNPGPYFETNKY